MGTLHGSCTGAGLIRARAAALTIAALLSASAQGAGPPPIEFKGIALGSVPTDANPVWRAFGCLYDRRCVLAPPDSHADFTIAEQRIGSITVTRNDRDQIQSISIDFATEGFEQVRSAIAAKYRGTTCDRSVVKNRMSATFDQVTCYYENKQGYIVVMKRADTVDTARVFMATHAAHVESPVAKRKRDRDL